MNMSGNSEINTVSNNENQVGAVELKDATTNTTKENGSEHEVRSEGEKIPGLVAAAGIENSEIVQTQRRHYSEADEDIFTNENTADVEGETDVEKFETATAGIETKIENYENKRTQRRHFSEVNADEVIDITEKENATNTEDEMEVDEEEMRKTEEAARVERKEVENCEGVRTQRKHFPGSTTSNIFR